MLKSLDSDLSAPRGHIYKGEDNMVTLSVVSLIGLLVVIPVGLCTFAYKFERKILDEIEEEIEEVEEESCSCCHCCGHCHKEDDDNE